MWTHYNTVRLHSGIGFVTPADMLAGRQAEIQAARNRKLEQARLPKRDRRELDVITDLGTGPGATLLTGFEKHQ